MKIRLENAVIMSDPNSPKPLSHDSSLRRVTASPVSSRTGFTEVFILFLLWRRLDQLLHIRPKHLVLGVFQVTEIVPLDREYKHEHRANSHAETRGDRDPGEFHLHAR